MGLKRITDLPAAGTLTGDELVEISQLSTTVTITATTLSAAATDNSYNDSGTGFVSAGFAVGDRVRVTGFTGDVANNILACFITGLTSGKMTIGGTDGDVIVDDADGESVTIAKWTTRRVELADIGIGGGAATVRTTTASDSFEVGDANNIVVANVGSANDQTVEDEATVDFPIGTLISVIQLGAGLTTIVAATGVTLNGVSAGTADMSGQYGAASLLKVGADAWNVVGTV